MFLEREKIRISPNPNGDTRTAIGEVSLEDFHKANISHIEDVMNVMGMIGSAFYEAGRRHDNTKLSRELEFYHDFCIARQHSEDPYFSFEKSAWYKMHVSAERHHLASDCPHDVTLIDVIEMIVDCVCAGKARAGKVRDIEINEEIMRNAFYNTVRMIDDMTYVVAEEKDNRCANVTCEPKYF